MNKEEESLTYYDVISMIYKRSKDHEERVKRLETIYIKVAILLTVIVFGYSFMLISLKSRIEEVENNVTIIHNN